MEGKVLDLARRLVREVVEDLRRRLATEVRRALWGKMDRRQRTPLRTLRNLDVRRTIRDNLRRYDREKRRIVLERIHFRSRVHRHNPWEVILAVDTSGSMMDSVIHSAVLAGIFKALPFLRVRLLVFDTEVVDLSDAIDDPVEILMGVQLGGGTDIGKALEHCEGLVRSPTRTIVAIVTDFCEGGDPRRPVAAVKRLRESGVKVLGLAALDSRAEPAYDRELAERCVEAGAEVAALTPRRLAEWLGKVLS
jgi:Mg-chelatase subunit ChlD